MPDKTLSHGRKSISASTKPKELMTNSPRLSNLWTADVITLYPNAFPGVLSESILGKSLEKKKWALEIVNLRDFGIGPHKKVDDTPAGGGAGLVLRADVIEPALEKSISANPMVAQRANIATRTPMKSSGERRCIADSWRSVAANLPCLRLNQCFLCRSK